MGFLDLFSSDFKKAVPAMAKENGWKVADVNDDRAVLQFEASAGRIQTLYILKYPHTLEFSAPSQAVFSTLDEVPDGLAARFLQRNTELRQGFWALEEIDNHWVFSMMYNEALARLHVNNFGQIARDLLSECDRFNSGA
jgi:hypothetical protein